MASVAASVAAADALAAAALELERARMRLNDVESYMAQRHWVNSQQVPETGRPMTWESMFCLRHNDFIDAHDALEQIRDLLNENDAKAALKWRWMWWATLRSRPSQNRPKKKSSTTTPKSRNNSCWMRCSCQRRQRRFCRLAAAASDWTTPNPVFGTAPDC